MDLRSSFHGDTFWGTGEAVGCVGFSFLFRAAEQL